MCADAVPSLDELLAAISDDLLHEETPWGHDVGWERLGTGTDNPQMTKLLEHAFAEASRLPDAEQDAMATVLLDELESGRRWSQLFAEHPEVQECLADEALEEHRADQAQPLIQADFRVPS